MATVSGKGSGRVWIAGLVCFQPGRRSSPPRLIYRTREHRGRKGERRSFAERDYADLLDAAHQQLGGPITAVWDNCETRGASPGDGVWPVGQLASTALFKICRLAAPGGAAAAGPTGRVPIGALPFKAPSQF